ncbi:MAG TPA: response regulator transcription factor [Opitutaceae bacterium]|jgi:two-component system KDP operon response regulator KdpE|nr:response regulator transcription factor [Opitutaceae bacterium]
MSMVESKPDVLLIDDEPQLRRLVHSALSEAGFAVRVAETGKLALGEVVLRAPDVVILDLGLPDIPGAEVLRALGSLCSAPVLILSVFGEEKDKVSALEAGADDYVTKPFGAAELVARLRALLRRSLASAPEPVYCFGPIEVHLASRRVLRDGQRVRLTSLEFALLNMFISNRDRVLTHKRILRELWGPAAEDRTHYIRIYMARLRSKLGDPGGAASYFQTESGVGYRFVGRPPLAEKAAGPKSGGLAT